MCYHFSEARSTPKRAIVQLPPSNVEKLQYFAQKLRSTLALRSLFRFSEELQCVLIRHGGGPFFESAWVVLNCCRNGRVDAVSQKHVRAHEKELQVLREPVAVV